MGHDMARGSDQEVSKTSQVESGVASQEVGILTLMDRVGSGQEVFKISRVGSLHPDPTRQDGPEPSHEKRLDP